MSVMECLIIVLMMIVIIGVVNERIFHLQSDIALIMFSLIFCGTLYIIGKALPGSSLAELLHEIGNFGFEEYLIDTVLCFMLFAGAGKVNRKKFGQNLKTIGLLALLSTVISSVLYGAFFYGIMKCLNISMDIWTCILLGCIVSPTDPIAATGILNKLGLSKNVTVVIESESLFNDGTGVALFVFVKSLVTHSGESNFVFVMLKEIGGAFLVALVISFIMTNLMKLTRDPIRQILISAVSVSLIYAICEHFGFSGVIASVLCGMLFAMQREKMKRRIAVEDPENRYEDFWEVTEGILNAALFVMIGLSVLDLEISSWLGILVPIAMLLAIIVRFCGVLVSGALIGRTKMPGNYSLPEFVSLMTWCALRGGLSLALAMSTKEILDSEVYLIILNVTYVTIFSTVILQGLTTKKIYYIIENHKAKRLRKESDRRMEKHFN